MTDRRLFRGVIYRGSNSISYDIPSFLSTEGHISLVRRSSKQTDFVNPEHALLPPTLFIQCRLK